MIQRYFTFRSDDAYEAFRAEADSRLGLPSPDGLTQTCIDAVVSAVRNTRGLPMVALSVELCGIASVDDALASAVSAGDATEIAEDDYRRDTASPEWP